MDIENCEGCCTTSTYNSQQFLTLVGQMLGVYDPRCRRRYSYQYLYLRYKVIAAWLEIEVALTLRKQYLRFKATRSKTSGLRPSNAPLYTIIWRILSFEVQDNYDLSP